MKIKFTKMHGIGNDYIYVNCMEKELPKPSDIAIIMSQRHFSVGADGLVMICSSVVADAKMRMFNADGSEGKMCGNAIRCVGKYLYDNGIVTKTEIKIETLSGIKSLWLFPNKSDKIDYVKVHMGKASFEPSDIPMNADEPLINGDITVLGKVQKVTVVSVGNPHAVYFVNDTKSLDLEKIGSEYENHPLFPERINSEFVEVMDQTNLRMRVWERGSGETYACGTGACATVAAAVAVGHCKRDSIIFVHLTGGVLKITYTAGGDIYMTGGATKVYDGEYEYGNKTE